jgi:hypothetical protein
MLYGASRAQETIMTHPNHEHLLKVLQKTRTEIIAGHSFGDRPQTDSDQESKETQSWPAEQSQTFPSTTADSSFDEDTLLTDDEIARQDKGGMSLLFDADVATFNESPSNDAQNAQQSTGQDRPGSAWDRLRAKAEQNKSKDEKKSVWGDDK